MEPGGGESADHQRVCVRLTNGLDERLLYGPNGDPERSVGARLSLQRTDPLNRLPYFRGLNLFLEVQPDWKPGICALNRVNDAQVRAHLRCSLHCESEHALGILAKANG